jgi:hypothetical protein
MSKGKGGTGVGPSTKAAAGSSGQASSVSSSRPSAPPSSTTTEASHAGPSLAAEAPGGAQQTQPQPAGGGKKEKERQRKERQKERKMEEAREALQGAMEAMEETAGAGCVGAVEEALAQAKKHEARSETLAALVAEAGTMLEQARAAAAERLLMEAEATSLTLRLQKVQQRLGSSVGPPAAPPSDEEMCVLCLDAPKDHIITPCGHQCVCGACAEKLKRVKRPTCPICREPIAATFKVFVA